MSITRDFVGPDLNEPNVYDLSSHKHQGLDHLLFHWGYKGWLGSKILPNHNTTCLQKQALCHARR